jgi:hypothetical protein
VNPISSGDISNLDITGVKNSLSSLASLTDFKTDAALNDLSNYVGSLAPSLTTAQVASSIFDWMINYTIDVVVVAAAAAAAIIAAGGGPEDLVADAAAAAAASAILLGGSSFGFDKFMAKIIDWVLAQTLSLEDVWDVGFNVTDVESWGAGIASRSIEVAFASPSAAIGFTNAILAELKTRGNIGDEHNIKRVYVGGYVSLRICTKTSALLGIERFSPNTFIVEYAMLSGSDSKYTGGTSHSYEDRILDFMEFLQFKGISMGGILHWGQTNSLLTNTILSVQFGANLTKFITTRNSHFHATTTFDNTFTRRLNI